MPNALVIPMLRDPPTKVTDGILRLAGVCLRTSDWPTGGCVNGSKKQYSACRCSHVGPTKVCGAAIVTTLMLVINGLSADALGIP